MILMLQKAESSLHAQCLECLLVLVLRTLNSALCGVGPRSPCRITPVPFRSAGLAPSEGSDLLAQCCGRSVLPHDDAFASRSPPPPPAALGV